MPTKSRDIPKIAKHCRQIAWYKQYSYNFKTEGVYYCNRARYNNDIISIPPFWEGGRESVYILRFHTKNLINLYKYRKEKSYLMGSGEFNILNRFRKTLHMPVKSPDIPKIAKHWLQSHGINSNRSISR